MDKRYITENIRTIDLDSMDSIYTDIDYFINIFTKIKEEYPNDKIGVCFNKSDGSDDDDYDYNESNTLDITLNRLETDKEYNNRIKAKERSKQKKQEEIEKKRLEKEANDKKEYLRLKRMFEEKL